VRPEPPASTPPAHSAHCRSRPTRRSGKRSAVTMRTTDVLRHCRELSGSAAGPSGGGALLAQDAEQPGLERSGLRTGVEYADRMRIAVVSGGSEQANRRMATQYELTHVLLQRERKVAESFNVHATPAAVLVSADGTPSRTWARGDCQLIASRSRHVDGDGQAPSSGLVHPTWRTGGLWRHWESRYENAVDVIGVLYVDHISVSGGEQLRIAVSPAQSLTSSNAAAKSRDSRRVAHDTTAVTLVTGGVIRDEHCRNA
jgi:hypothetical protein